MATMLFLRSFTWTVFPAMNSAFLGFSFRPLLDAVQLPCPELLKCLYPVVHSLELVGIEFIEAVLALPRDLHHTNLSQHPQVLGNGWLRKAELPHNVTHRPGT